MELTAKVFLTAYNDIPRMIKSLDKCINYTINCGLGANQFYSGITTDDIFEKIIICKNRQDILATVKNLVEKIFPKMKRNNAKILYLKYIKKLTFKQISLSLNVNLRSIFRYYDNAISEFVYYLRVLGYDNSDWYKGEKYLDFIEKNLQDREIQEIKKEKNQIEKRQTNQLKKIKNKFSEIENAKINVIVDIKV